MKFEGKVSLVTGAGQGIGKAIAFALANEGSTVVVNDIKEETARTVSEDIVARGEQAITIKADISKREEVEDMIEKTIRSFKRIDILVNNAGVQTETPFLDLSEEEWDRIIDTNLKGTFLCSQLAAREMVKQGGGKIINISSIHEFFARSNIAHYAASKGGIAMLTKVMALELARYKINVTAIAPGAVATGMNADLLSSPQKLAEMSSKIPWGRIATPEEVAKVAIYLVSQDAEYIIGSTIYMDGGFSLSGHDKP